LQRKKQLVVAIVAVAIAVVVVSCILTSMISKSNANAEMASQIEKCLDSFASDFLANNGTVNGEYAPNMASYECYAYSIGNISYCDMSGDPGACRIRYYVAKSFSSGKNLCSDISDHYGAAVCDSILSGDPSNCSEIKTFSENFKPELRNYSQYLCSAFASGDVSYCSTVPEYFYSYCNNWAVTFKGIRSHDTSVCNKIMGGHLGLKSHKESVCAGMVGGDARNCILDKVVVTTECMNTINWNELKGKFHDFCQMLDNQTIRGYSLDAQMLRGYCLNGTAFSMNV
jgi:hypothetical protein